jgi:hypothetical protein
MASYNLRGRQARYYGWRAPIARVKAVNDVQ